MSVDRPTFIAAIEAGMADWQGSDKQAERLRKVGKTAERIAVGTDSVVDLDGRPICHCPAVRARALAPFNANRYDVAMLIALGRAAYPGTGHGWFGMVTITEEST